jgi:hypothetical protein
MLLWLLHCQQLACYLTFFYLVALRLQRATWEQLRATGSLLLLLLLLLRRRCCCFCRRGDC